MYIHLYRERRNSVSRIPEKTGYKEEIKKKIERTQCAFNTDAHKIPVSVLWL